MEFNDWINLKFYEWRGNTRNSTVEFSKFLDVKQQTLSAWMNGKYAPKDAINIGKLAEKYPEVYEVLGVDPPPQNTNLPPFLRKLLDKTLTEISETIKERKIPLDSPEAEKLTIEILERNGFTVDATAKR